MPTASELFVRGRTDIEYVAEELERYRSKPIDGDAIRLVHQELSNLSAKAWRWILPHYLRFCLTAEAEYNRMETEFLIYNLAPELQFQTDTSQRLSLLTAMQVACLIDFLGWCFDQEYWKEYCPQNINRAISFLQTVLLAKNHEQIQK